MTTGPIRSCERCTEARVKEREEKRERVGYPFYAFSLDKFFNMRHALLDVAKNHFQYLATV